MLVKRSQHIPISLQPFPIIKAVKIQRSPFQYIFLHILASPGFAPGTIAVNVTWIEREFNAGQTPRSMYPSIFNGFLVIQAVKSKVRNFSTTFFCKFWSSPGYAPGTIAVSVIWIEREFIQCLSNASQHVPIYLQPFLRHSELLVENCDIFRPHLCLAAPQEVTPSEFREALDMHKTRMNGLSCGEEIMTIRSAVLIQYQRVTDGQTDRQTDVQPISTRGVQKVLSLTYLDKAWTSEHIFIF